MKLYELQDILVNIDNVIATSTDEETGVIMEEAKQKVLDEVAGKMENICEYIADCKGKIDQLKAEQERIYNKRKTLENRVEWLKNCLLMSQMKFEQKTKAEYGTWTISVAKTPEKVVVANEDLIPDDLCTFKREINKTAIKGAMTDGRLVIDGMTVANLQSGETIRIK